MGMREDVRRAGLRHRQARESMRRGDRADPRKRTRRRSRPIPTSAFGGIIAFNREVDEAAAQAVAKQFVEVLIAPSFSDAAKQVFAAKQNVRVLQIRARRCVATRYDFKRVGGGLLMQSPDAKNVLPRELSVVTKRMPTPQANGRSDVRLARREVREVERDRVLRQAA